MSDTIKDDVWATPNNDQHTLSYRLGDHTPPAAYEHLANAAANADVDENTLLSRFRGTIDYIKIGTAEVDSETGEVKNFTLDDQTPTH